LLSEKIVLIKNRFRIPTPFALIGTGLAFGLFFASGCEPKGSSQAPVEFLNPSDAPPPNPISDQQRLMSAARLLQAGQVDEAEKSVRSLLIRSPHDLNANALLVSILVEQKHHAAAVNTLDELAVLHPDQRDLLEAQAADCVAGSGDAEGAIIRFKKLVQRNPEFMEGRRRLAELLNLRGYRFDANEHLRYLAGRTSLQFEELRGILFPARTWVNVNSKPDIGNPDQIQTMGLLNAAIALRVKGDVRDALSLLAQSVLYAQGDSSALSLYGWTLADSQQYDQLQQWIAQVGESCERYPEYWLAAGGLALHENDEAAVSCFAEAIRREPSLLEAHHGLVQALEAAGQPKLAETFRERVKLIQQSQWLIREIVGNKEPSQGPVMRLAALLKEQGRAIESLAWQEFLISEMSPNAPQLQVIRDYKSKILQAMPSGRDEIKLLCNLDETKFKSITEWLAIKRSTNDVEKMVRADAEKSNKNSRQSLAPPVFTNVAPSVDLDFRYRNATIPVEREFQIFQAYGGGIACLDFDCDGRVDMYFGQAAGTPPHDKGTEANGFFRNLGSRFVSITESAGVDDRGYTFGVTAGDWNQDGFLDLVVGNLGRNRLLINQGDGTFRPDTNEPWNDSKFTTSVAMADITRDHLPDIIEVNYLDDERIYEPIQYGGDGKPLRLPGPLHFKPGTDRVLVSTGNGQMIAQSFGNQNQETASTGLGLLVTDIDGKIGNEVFVANDLRANQLWIRTEKSDGQSGWTDVAVPLGVAYGNAGMPMACMGIAAADFDGNQRLDLHITNFEDQWSNQYMQNAAGSFVDQALPFGIDIVSLKLLGFGTQAIDYDNNGLWDLVVGNGHVEDYTERGSSFAMPTQILINVGSEFTASDVQGDDTYWKSPHWSRGLAKCDWNDDGQMDFVVTDLKENVALLENRSQSNNHWLKIDLVGAISERDVIGAKVEVECDSKTFTQVCQSGDGYLSKNEPGLCFGLASTTLVDRLRIRWPSGNEQTFENIKVDSRVLVIEGDSTPWRTEVSTFRCPSDPGVGAPALARTNYAGCIGDSSDWVNWGFWRWQNNTWNQGHISAANASNRGFFYPRKAMRFRDILDGLSNTMACAEIATDLGDRDITTSPYYQAGWTNVHMNPAHCETLRDPLRPRFWAPTVPTDARPGLANTTWKRGFRWSDSVPVYTCFTAQLPPNREVCIGGGGDFDTGTLPPSSRHQGGCHILMGDGSVKFVTDSIEAGNSRAQVVMNGNMINPAGSQSPYGLWGALGTRASKENVSMDF